MLGEKILWEDESREEENLEEVCAEGVCLRSENCFLKKNGNKHSRIRMYLDIYDSESISQLKLT